MDSDDELPEEPPPEYLQMRRRSNTLPKDFLSKLRAKKDLDELSTDDEDETDNDEIIQGVELHRKLNKLAIQNGENNKNYRGGRINSGKNGLNKVKTQRERINNNIENHTSRTPPKIKVLPPLKQKGSNLDRPSSSSSSKSESTGQAPVAKNADILLNKLMKDAVDEELECTTRVRSPLPRGSNLYEKLLEDFGHQEEARDTVSPLPSPEIRRKRRNIRSANIEMPVDVTQSLPGTPPGRHRRVHWSQDTHFNKYK